jgi:hypothetical protein
MLNRLLPMDLKKLSPSLLAVLGLACARTPPTVGPCLSPPYEPPVEDTGDSGTTGEPTDPGPVDEPPIGPCLSPPAPEPAIDSPGATASATAAPEPAGSRRDALERVLARATLPADVAERLRRRSEPNHGS